ncbi:MAG: hypothetical protein U1F57_05455 [bacterium]
MLPFQTVAGSTNNTFDFTYTAVNDMGDGSVRLSTANGFPNPVGGPSNSAGYTTCTVNSTAADPGVLADIFDDLDNPVIAASSGADGWQAKWALKLGSIQLSLLNPTVARDTVTFYDPPASLKANTTLTVGVGNLLELQTYENLSAAKDLSGYNKMSFWVKLSAFVATNVDLGASELILSSSRDLGSGSVSYNLSGGFTTIDLVALSGGNWAHVKVDLTKNGTLASSTRQSVQSLGLLVGTNPLSALQLNALTQLNLDNITFGGPGASCVFSGNTVTAHLIEMSASDTVVFSYQNVTAPTQTGTYTFPVAEQSNSNGSLTNIPLPHPQIEVLASPPPPPTCGDGTCNGTEDCNTCASDCGSCNPPLTCGDGACNGTETCGNCPQDCGICNPPTCGDHACNGGETCGSCPVDCGTCNPPTCGDQLCNGSETCGNCPQDCGSCNQPTCDNGVCDGNETCGNCPQDCGSCNPPAVCGNGTCEAGETCGNCAQDCLSCAPPNCDDGVCDSDETCGNCPQDCGTCGTVGAQGTPGGGGPAVPGVLQGSGSGGGSCAIQTVPSSPGSFLLPSAFILLLPLVRSARPRKTRE